ncbi:VWA domain-containing protein [Ornithinibacillus salinisoli]|uniref:VWA domain-containing protein n=1 Tax=Ornithinibacillus salinisoli TaxID=1848459 RepID=A0ABW4W2V6_9BACI
MELQIEQPLFFILLIPVIGILYLYWKKNNVTPKPEKYTILALRSIIFICIIFALTIPHLLFPVNGVNTVFVVDQSESVKNQQGNMYEEIEQAISTMSTDDHYAIVTVGEEGKVSQTWSSREKGLVTNKVLDKTTFTNLEEGLQIASSLLSSNQNGRIVLLTDGNENIGDVIQQVALLNQQQIPVDVIPYTTSVPYDVAIDQFDIPSNLYLGEHADLSISLSSTVDTNSRIRITKDNETVIDEEVQVKQGTNAYTFNYAVESTGNHRFHAEIATDEDGIIENNIADAITTVKGNPTALLVEGDEGEGDNISTALQASNLQVDKTIPKLLPTKLAGLLDYETIIFSNVTATDITQDQMEIIESAVRDFGVGFVMTGGNKSYGLGGYFKTPIENLLPVEMDLKGKKELPSLGMIIVMDRSGSMSGHKIDLAKEAAARSVDLLRNTDTLGFIAFDDQPWQIIDTEPLHDKEEAIDKIRSITEGGGTEIFTSLQEAYSQLEPLELKRKHIILLTDGQSATNGDYSAVISQGLEHNVTLSTVAIGSDADRTLLEDLAEEGTGRFYDVQDASTIPSILSRETILTTRTYIEDEPFYPSYMEGTEWSHLFQNGVPEMNAYVATDPKDRAEIVLLSEKEDPVLARWKYGLGNTIAWTSDVRGEWSGAWPAWENWPTLWNEMITWSLPNYQQDVYDIKQTRDGRQVILSITSEDADLLPLEAEVVDEKGNEVEAQIRTTAPGAYEVTFSAETGVYYLQLSKMQEDQIIGSFQAGIVVPYSEEFELLHTNQTLINEIAAVGEGKVIDSPEDAFRSLDRNSFERQPISMVLLFIAFLIFFIEVAIRRFGIMSILHKIRTSRSEKAAKFDNKKQNMEQTYDRLKKSTNQTKTKHINQSLKEEDKVEQNKWGKEPSITPVMKPKTEKKQKEVDHPTEGSNDRMKRLLDAKNRKGK